MLPRIKKTRSRAGFFFSILNLSDSIKYEYGFKIWYQDGTIKDWHSEDKFITLDRCPNVANLSVTTPNPTRAIFACTSSLLSIIF